MTPWPRSAPPSTGDDIGYVIDDVMTRFMGDGRGDVIVDVMTRLIGDIIGDVIDDVMMYS